jgi:hypothetical protein
VSATTGSSVIAGGLQDDLSQITAVARAANAVFPCDRRFGRTQLESTGLDAVMAEFWVALRDSHNESSRKMVSRRGELAGPAGLCVIDHP